MSKSNILVRWNQIKADFCINITYFLIYERKGNFYINIMCFSRIKHTFNAFQTYNSLFCLQVI